MTTLRIFRDDINNEVYSMVSPGPGGFRLFELLQQIVRYIAPDIVEDGCTLMLSARVSDNDIDDYMIYRIAVKRTERSFDVTYNMRTGRCGADHFELFI